jgi:threonine aldolase
LENTTNKGGGACYDLEEIKKIRKVCNTHGLGLHLDGARLFNALVAKGESPKEYGKLFDTISVCLSKGLGTPMGSVLIGNSDLMKNAIRVRKVLGGGMRQVGFMAAAGIYALDKHVERLADDNKRAKEIGNTLAVLPYILKVETVETNIAIFYLKDAANEESFMKQLQKENIRISNMGHGKLRIVTHLDYSEEQHQKFLRVLKEIQF